jgi:hypothetical protein
MGPRPLNAALAFVTNLLRVSVVCAALLAPSAEACVCRDRRLPEEEKIIHAVQDSKYVMLARVSAFHVSQPAIDGTVRITGTFEAIESFKGDAPSVIPIADQRIAGAYSSSCAEGLPSLSVGDVALLYLEQPTVDKWTFDHCSRSRIVESPSSDDEVAALRRAHARTEG